MEIHDSEPMLPVVIGDVTERLKGQSHHVHVLGRFWSRHKSSPPAKPNFVILTHQKIAVSHFFTCHIFVIVKIYYNNIIISYTDNVFNTAYMYMKSQRNRIPLS